MLTTNQTTRTVAAPTLLQAANEAIGILRFDMSDSAAQARAILARALGGLPLQNTEKTPQVMRPKRG